MEIIRDNIEALMIKTGYEYRDEYSSDKQLNTF